MLSLQKKFLFIHVPKTGGNSVQNIIREFSEDRIIKNAHDHDGFEEFEVRNDQYAFNKHSTYRDYKSQIEAPVFQELYKFATVRNPWDRMISFYFSPHRRIGGEWDRDNFIQMLKEVRPVRRFVRDRSVLERVSIRAGWGENWFARQKLDQDIDFIIRFEALNEDFAQVCTRLDIPYSPLPHRNKSKRQHYSHYYDTELIELVRARFPDEIAFGNYEFESAPGVKI
jgi:hypothetical protein